MINKMSIRSLQVISMCTLLLHCETQTPKSTSQRLPATFGWTGFERSSGHFTVPWARHVAGINLHLYQLTKAYGVSSATFRSNSSRWSSLRGNFKARALSTWYKRAWGCRSNSLLNSYTEFILIAACLLSNAKNGFCTAYKWLGHFFASAKSGWMRGFWDLNENRNWAHGASQSPVTQRPHSSIV